MASFAPMTSLGDNLGQRHRHLNSLVREAYESGASFHEVEALPEQSPVDRLFKIDLATKLENKDYIIRNLKDDDMLYVSRALRSTWLLDHHDIINPRYLEEVFFPEMVTQAVSKMKHWLYINLRDPAMCQEFYQYYKENKFEFAMKFLSHCSHDFIVDEVAKILAKLSTHHLKILSEKCPKVAKIYFDSLATDEDVRTRYLGQEQSYYNSVKCVLKSDADVFLDITEKYFSLNSFSRLSRLATDYILRYHKSRFTKKTELYVAYLLHIPTLAELLSIDECQEIVIKLARANYLQHRFEYKLVEPLIKRLSPDKRAAFKKRVFVEKEVGECVAEWQYETPQSPPYSNSDSHVFDDEDFIPVRYKYGSKSKGKGNALKRLMKRRKCKHAEYIAESCMIIKSELDRLFDEFRFIGFDRALHDLGQRLGAAGSADRRRDIFLVLVSKSGGRSDAVAALLRLAARHSNEPANTRAAVLRSLVKRANVWRLPADVWQNLLDFGHGLGLDGATPEASCREGLHAVVIRQLLADECESAVRTSFLSDFSTLAEYSLKADERVRVVIGLQNILTAAAAVEAPAIAAELLGKLLDVQEIYHVRVEPASPTVKAVMALALCNAEVARPLLERLYIARIARRDLLRVNLEFRRDEAALLNALRHDPPALKLRWIVEILTAGEVRYDRFISKLVVYYNQKGEFSLLLRAALKEKIAHEKIEQKLNLARPLASLMGNDFERELRDLDDAGTEQVKFAASLRACAHRARPVVCYVEWGWRKAGVKAIATRVMCCREIERARFTRALAAERRTVRVALALSMRSKGELLLDTFASAAKLRPVVALRAALQYFLRHDASADLRVWDIVKPLFFSVDLSSRKNLHHLLGNIDWIPSSFKSNYCITLYLAISKITNSNAEYVLCNLSKVIHVNDDSFENVLIQILENTDKDTPMIPYPAIFVRYLMLSRNYEDLENRFTKIGDRFLERLDTLRCEKDSCFQERLDQIIKSLKYNAAFLDIKFTSCLSVIEIILAWMQKFMPKEEYFKAYVQIHLTMLFFKAVRQSIKEMPEVFDDVKRTKSEGVDAVGFIFGRYIAKEVAELADAYFDSIIELYTGALDEYLEDYFMYGSSRANFIGSMLKGMLAEAVGSQRRLAIYIHKNRRYDMDDSMRQEIEGLMLKDKAIDFFVYGELFV